MYAWNQFQSSFPAKWTKKVLKLQHDLFCLLLVLNALINLNPKLQFYNKASFSVLTILLGLEDFEFIVVEDRQHDDDND